MTFSLRDFKTGEKQDGDLEASLRKKQHGGFGEETFQAKEQNGERRRNQNGGLQVRVKK